MANGLARFVDYTVRRSAPGRLTKDMAGQVVGRLTVIEPAASLGTGARWRCKCGVCGGMTVIKGSSLRAALKRNAADYACERCKPNGSRRKL